MLRFVSRGLIARQIDLCRAGVEAARKGKNDRRASAADNRSLVASGSRAWRPVIRPPFRDCCTSDDTRPLTISRTLNCIRHGSLLRDFVLCDNSFEPRVTEPSLRLIRISLVPTGTISNMRAI
jgi:hypothetical protein